METKYEAFFGILFGLIIILLIWIFPSLIDFNQNKKILLLEQRIMVLEMDIENLK